MHSSTMEAQRKILGGCRLKSLHSYSTPFPMQTGAGPEVRQRANPAGARSHGGGARIERASQKRPPAFKVLASLPSCPRWNLALLVTKLCVNINEAEPTAFSVFLGRLVWTPTCCREGAVSPGCCRPPSAGPWPRNQSAIPFPGCCSDSPPPPCPSRLWHLGPV